MRASVLSDLAAAAQDPGTDGQQAMVADALWRPPLRPARCDGTLETLAALTPDDLRAMHQALFARDNLYVGIVGAIDAEDAAAALDLLFGNLPRAA